MSKPIIRIHNLANNEIIDREMNDEEFAAYQADLDTIKKEEVVKEQLLSNRNAILEKLGITEDEAKLLLS